MTGLDDRTTLRALVAEELSLPVDPRVSAFAADIARRHGAASRAVLFYGSCLRQAELDDGAGAMMLDFYLIVRDYRSAYTKRWLAAANALIPPNVFHAEHAGLVAKYAVLSEADFRREVGGKATSPSVWARFAQPSRLVWAADEEARTTVTDVIQDAAPTLFQYTLPMLGHEAFMIERLWKRGFELTFASELRAERTARAAAIVEADPARYELFGRAALARIASLSGVGPNGEVPLLMRPDRMARWWKGTQRKGKLLSVARLAKASLTFAGGADYIVWKINRHAGTDFALKPWQRRHPLLGALSLLPRLLKSGAIK